VSEKNDLIDKTVIIHPVTNNNPFFVVKKGFKKWKLTMGSGGGMPRPLGLDNRKISSSKNSWPWQQPLIKRRANSWWASLDAEIACIPLRCSFDSLNQGYQQSCQF
jgi:hypothetical protein